MSGRWISRVYAGTGPRGSGKSLWLTVVQTIALIQAHYLGFNVWSNYPVGFNFYDRVSKRWVYLCSNPLNITALAMFEKGFVNGWIFIDEIDKWLDRQEWSSMTSRLIVQVLTMIRKRHLSMGMTIQDLNWLNGRGQFQTDVEVNCRDASFSPWGQSVKLQGGEIVNQIFKDLSGTYTGYTYAESGMVYRSNMMAKWAFKNYDTDSEFNPMAEKTTLTIKKKEMEYDNVTGEMIDVTARKQSELQDYNDDLMKVSDLILNLQGQGIEQINKSELRGMALQEGIQSATDIKEFAKMLSRFNVDISSRVYYGLLYANDIKRMSPKLREVVQNTQGNTTPSNPYNSISTPSGMNKELELALR